RLAREASQRRTQPLGTVALAGDFLPDGPVGEAIRKHGAEWPWTGVAALTARCDLAVCNLEAPLSAIGWKINEYRGEPAAVKGLRAAGIDAVTLANDHILDYDDPALLSTLALLDREEIAHAGAGHTLARARQPALLRLGETRVALLSYGRPELGRSRTGRRWEASPWSPGIAPAVAAEVQEDVRRAKKEAQVVLVAFHWGGEGEETPRPEDRALARLAVEAGATVVFGHGPGLVQGLEVHGNGLILYNLGACVRQGEDSARSLGLIARLSLAGGQVQGLELIPVRTEEGRAVLLKGEEAAAVLRLSGERSRQAQSEPPAPDPGKEEQTPAAAGNRSPAWYSARGGGHTHERSDRDRSTQPP
ncbi:MAG TPA: CapA family protein, partial [Firmicutes bacterium]|nr:CapA family protein [Bacillota bacterium]